MKDLRTNISFFFCKNIMGLKSAWGVFYVDWQTLGYVGMGILHLWLTYGELLLWNWQVAVSRHLKLFTGYCSKKLLLNWPQLLPLWCVCLSRNTLLLSYIQAFSYLPASLDRSTDATHIAQIMLGFKVQPFAVAAENMNHTLWQKARDRLLWDGDITSLWGTATGPSAKILQIERSSQKKWPAGPGPMSIWTPQLALLWYSLLELWALSAIDCQLGRNVIR